MTGEPPYYCKVQQLSKTSVAADSASGCAAEILDVVPVVMCFIRTQMRRHRGADLSVPQFRTLAYLSHQPGTSLSALAEFLGLSLPATSRLVDGLVRKSLVVRQIPPGNRRLVALSASVRGQKSVCAARRATEKHLSEVVTSLREGDREMIQRALRVLHKEFTCVPGRTDL